MRFNFIIYYYLKRLQNISAFNPGIFTVMSFIQEQNFS